MDCSACGERLANGAAFCHRCGARQSVPACASCRAELIPGAAFCATCGQPTGLSASSGMTDGAGPSAERRLTSVLFADLVSYTTLSEQRDTEDVRELLTAYFDVCGTVLRRYGGTVEKFIGDAVMAVWGVPVAHEDDAERAVRSALELVAQVAGLGERLGVDGLAVRVGVVTGEVTATLGARDQGMVAGDPVNTAARIQAVAGVGEVFVDATTRLLTAAAVAYSDAGEHHLKGKSEPVRLHRAESVVAAIGGAQRVDGLEAPLVGRERELRLLKELFHGIEETRRPHLVVLDGEAGIGKSRLGWELEKYADGLTSTVRWHRGRCLSYGDGVAFWALAEAVRARVGAVGESGGEALAGLDDLLAQVSDEAERAWLRPRVASLLGEESREFAREDLFAAWTRFFGRVAGDHPLVLVVEDAEHVDDGLADYLDFLVTNATFPCFVLLLARPELLAARPQLGGRRSTPLRLEPLPDHSMGQLVDGLVGGLPDEVRRGLVQRAEGIPLYAVETVRALIDRDLVVPVEGRYVVAPGSTLDLSSIGAPASLHALVAARLDALEPVERRVLSDASVLGESFTRAGLGVLTEDVPDLERVLGDLQRKQLVAIELDRFSADRGNYRFVQSVVRQVSYGTLSRRDRKARHLCVAEHLAGDDERADELSQVIARHLLDAAEAAGPDDPAAGDLRARAGDLLVRAGERAEGLGAYADACRCYAAAVGCLPDVLGRARALRRQAEAHGMQNQLPALLARAEESLALLEEKEWWEEAAESAVWVVRGLSTADRPDEALAVAQSWLARLEDLEGADRPRARLLTGLAGILLFQGRAAESQDPLATALRLLDRVDDPKTFAHACNILAIYHTRFGSRQIGQMLLDGMAERARKDENWLGVLLALANSAVQLAIVDLPEAIRSLDEGGDTGVAHGIAPDDIMLTNRLNFAWLAGRWDRVAEDLEKAASWPVPLTVGAHVAAAIGALMRWAGAVVPVEVPPPEDEYSGVYPGVQEFGAGALALAAGDLTTATRELGTALHKELVGNGVLEDLQVFWPLAVRVALEADELTDELLLVTERALQEAPPVSSLVGHAHVFRALLAERNGGSDPAEIETDLREGVRLLDRCGQVVWCAHAQEDLGRWLVEQGRPEEAEPFLTAARSTYADLGATSWLARVESAQKVG